MFTGQMNRVSAARWAVCLLLTAFLLAAAGCGGKDEAETPGPPQKKSMVPAAAGTSRVDSTWQQESAAAAESKAMSNTAEVEPAEVLKPAEAADKQKVAGSAVTRSKTVATGGTISIQLGSFRSVENAEAQATRIRELGYAPVVEVATLGGETYHRVVLNGLSDRAAAERIGEKVRSQLGITYLIRQK